MVSYSTVILKFADNGEKTGWTYIEVPSHIAQELVPGNKKSFRVRGTLDLCPIEGVALMPMGEGNFIMAINAEMRKCIRKSEGAMLQVSLEVHVNYFLPVPDELMEYFESDPEAEEYFNSLAKSHREYFIKWIDSAKTAATREKRIVNTANAMARKMDYGQMIRSMRLKD